MLVECLMLVFLCILLVLLVIYREDDNIVTNTITFIVELAVIGTGACCIVKGIEYISKPPQEISLYGHTYSLKE